MRRIAPILTVILLTAAFAVAMEAKLFDHDYHISEIEPDCGVCHQPEDLEIGRAADRCLECHEETFLKESRIPARITHDSFWYRDHGPYAEDLDNNCAACHEENECLDCHKAGFADEQGKLNIHRSDFRVTHPIQARADDRSCTVCHDQSFCTDCHGDFAPEDLAFESHRRGFSDILAGVTPHETFDEAQCSACHTDSVLPSHDWSDSHAREARRSLPTCQACHPQADVCLKCHSAREGLIVNPHPSDWDEMKDYLDGASGGKTCRRCH